MDFFELIERVNNIKTGENNNVAEIVNNIDIDENNIDDWIDNVFSDKVNSFDMDKLPYLIDELYVTNDKLKFMLCCMLLESTCDQLKFITNLERYPLFVAKFQSLVKTLTAVYEHVDNGISNCMSLIIINNDPKFSYFDEELKGRIISATKRKLKDILNYLKGQKYINSSVYDDLEIIADLSCYLNDEEIKSLIDEIDHLGNNENADIFIMKFKALNGIKPLDDKLNLLKNDYEKLYLLYNIMEKLGINDLYLNDISQEDIAKSDMIRWLKYPTEIGAIPDKIEFLGEFIYNNSRCYAYKFSKDDFKITGDLLGVSGGYPIDKTSSNSSGYTFSKFEKVQDNWEEQANELVSFIASYWEKRGETASN